MRELGLRGAVRGRAFTTTTCPDPTPRPADLVNRTFVATRPNALWVADLTFVATWRRLRLRGVRDRLLLLARCIVGWRVSSSLRTDLALDGLPCGALEQALYARPAPDGLVHHSDRGGQYLSIRYTDRLAESGIEPSVGSVGDSYDNALAESVIGLYKTRSDSSARPVAASRGRGVCDARMGGLVQQPAALDVDRRRATGRVRTAVLSGTRSASHNGRSQLMSSPETRRGPGPFFGSIRVCQRRLADAMT